MMRRALILLLVTFGSANLVAENSEQMPLDTTIRVLIIRDPGVDQNFIDDSVDFLQDTWAGTAGTRTVSITIVNPGMAIDVPISGGDPLVALNQIRTYSRTIFTPLVHSARDIAAADLVIGFTDRILDNACGAAQSGNWLGDGAIFDDLADGLDDEVDTSGAANWFVAVIEEGCSGDFGTLSHEFGHLLGGMHQIGGLDPLLPNGRGDFIVPPVGPRGNIRSRRTTMAEVDACGTGVSAGPCTRLLRYSDPVNFGDPNRQMVQTIDLTAESVANFIRALPIGNGIPPSPPLALACADGDDNDGDSFVDGDDPDCSGPTDDDETPPPPPPAPPATCDPANYVPTNVSVKLTDVCLPGTSSSGYLVTWQHACPGGTYEMWGNDNGGAGDYLVLITPIQSAPIVVTGSTSTLRVRACNRAFCSSLSIPPVGVLDRC